MAVQSAPINQHQLLIRKLWTWSNVADGKRGFSAHHSPVGKNNCREQGFLENEEVVDDTGNIVLSYK